MNIFKVFILGFQVFSTKVNLVCSNEIEYSHYQQCGHLTY